MLLENQAERHERRRKGTDGSEEVFWERVKDYGDRLRVVMDDRVWWDARGKFNIYIPY